MQLTWVPQAQGLVKLQSSCGLGLQLSEDLHGAGTSASQKAHLLSLPLIVSCNSSSPHVPLHRSIWVSSWRSNWLIRVSSPRQGKKEAMVYFMAQSKKSSTVNYATFSLLEISPQVHTEDSQGRSIERFTEVIFKPSWCHWTLRHIERLGLGWREKKGHFFKMSYYQHIKSEIDSVKDSWSFEF